MPPPQGQPRPGPTRTACLPSAQRFLAHRDAAEVASHTTNSGRIVPPMHTCGMHERQRTRLYHSHHACRCAALAAMATSHGRPTHAWQPWLAGCATHVRNPTVRSRGLRQGASRLDGGRGRAFDRRSRPHLDELRPLFLRTPRPIARSEHCRKQQAFLGRSRAHTASVREAPQHVGSAHDTRAKRSVKATSSRATARSRAVRGVPKAYQSDASSMVGVRPSRYRSLHLRGMPRVPGVNDTISKAELEMQGRGDARAQTAHEYGPGHGPAGGLACTYVPRALSEPLRLTGRAILSPAEW